MRLAKPYVLTLAAGALAALGGCQMIGPTSIALGRDRYNSVIQETSMEQTMSNIVRVYNHQPPMFMDVNEVDAQLQFVGQVTGQTTGIGASAGQSGSTGGTVSYSETPVIKYIPLTGQALVAQLVTPVSVDALGLLYDSDWDVAPLLDFSSAYLTLDYRKFYSSLNTIDELNQKGALELTAAKSGLANPPPPATGKPASNDSLLIYLRPFHGYEQPADLADKQRVLQLWVRMFRIYFGTQPSFDQPRQCAAIGLKLDDEKSLQDWDVNIEKHITALDDQQKQPSGALQNQRVDNARACLPGAIELRVVPEPIPAKGANASTASPPAMSNYAPLMRTYSALGILKNATERPNPKIEFVTPEQYRQIRGHAWNQDEDSSSYYTLLPRTSLQSGEEDSVNCSDAQKQKGGCETPLPPNASPSLNVDIDRWIQNSAAQNSPVGTNTAQSSDDNYPSGLDVYEAKGQDVLANEYVNLNGRLGTLRRYILIVVDDHLPQEPVYVSYTDGRKWYYIAKDDIVSEKNYQLLTLFMTMMAIPPATQPLSSVISLGG